MRIRTRLSITFFFIVIVVLTISWMAVYFFAESNRKVDFSRRLKNRALNTARVLTEVREVNAELQRRLEQNNPASLPDQYIVIIDSLGNEIYRSSGPDRLAIDPEILRRVKQDGEIYYARENRETIGFTYESKNGEYIILATAFDQYGNESITNIRNILILTFIFGVVLVSGLSWIYSGHVLKPISKIIGEVSNINEKNLSKRLEEGNQQDELGQLSRTFNDMLSRLQNSFLSQKSFIANASHEIKTPITIMSGEIEVSLLQDRDRSYYTRLLQSVLQGLRRLNTLSTQLLLLAESTNQGPERRFSSFRLDDVLWETKEWLEKGFNGYSVEIHFDLDIDADALSLMGDEPLVRAAILNLMDNGCKYSTDSQVSIRVDTSTKNWITLTFINSATISQEEMEKIFAPFYRSPANRTGKGFGIGLSLVNNVVRLHKGQLTATSKDGVTQFMLKFPLQVQL